jgi:hypothetical protein
MNFMLSAGLRMPKLLEKSYGLDSGNVESLSATDIFAPHHVVAPNHVALCLGKARSIPVIGSARKLIFLPPYDPVQLVFALLSAVRAGHRVASLF